LLALFTTRRCAAPLFGQRVFGRVGLYISNLGLA
jgi:hypothetical protein